jgi:hypothetical protein
MEKMVKKAEEAVYMKMLKSGPRGIDYQKLYLEMEEEEGYERDVVNKAVHKLLKNKYIMQNKENTNLVVSIREITQAKATEILVEKVLPGEAIVLIDGIIRARLEPANYNGPGHLIKKNARFEGYCELHNDSSSSGMLSVRVRSVTSTPST